VFVCRSTLQHLTDEELDSSIYQELQHNLMRQLNSTSTAEDPTLDLEYFDDTNHVSTLTMVMLK
jgi:hypothetical protein